MTRAIRFGLKLIELFCSFDYLEMVQGDLIELYELRVIKQGFFVAYIRFYLDVISSIFRFFSKGQSHYSNNAISMFKINILTSYRHLIKNKGYAAINILGLAIGISFSCILYVYVNNELSYDAFHDKSDRIFRTLMIDKRVPDQERTYATSMPPLAPALVADFPEVEDMVRLIQFTGQVVFKIDGKSHQERNWFTTDSNFFDLFDFEFVAGDSKTALKNPYSLVLNESTAKKYFGNETPIGEVMEMANLGAVTITGVVKDLPDNSHIKFNMLFSEIRNDDDWKNYLGSWESYGAYAYILTSSGGEIENLRAKMPEFQQKYLGSMANSIAIDFQEIEDIYFGSSNIEYGIETRQDSGNGQIKYIYIFTTLGIFMLLIACINYINLATAKAVYRAKEIGVRKVVGAIKKQLVIQFLIESLLVSFIALIFALGIIDLVLPYFNQITGKEFVLNITTISTYLAPLLVLTIVIGILSGSYPAFYLAQLKPVSTLRGEMVGKKSAGMRKVLVIFQFTLTIVMIAATLIIARQLNFIKDKNIGFDKENILVIDINSRNVRSQFQAMKNEFAAIPGVESVGVSSRVPGEWKNITETYVKNQQSNDGALDSILTYFMGFDEGMMKTYNFKLKAGRYFVNNNKNDSTKILLNEAAVKILGLKNPLESFVEIPTREGTLNAQIIGVISDFNFQSLHQKIAPIVIGSWNNPFQSIDYFSLKISGNPQQIIEAANVVHRKFDLNTPMELHFLDKQLENFYVAETRAGLLFTMVAGLSIFVACLGLFGLASFIIQKRKKELGIRKVLGAKDSNLFILLSSTFTKQIGIAFLIASPIAYYIMYNWLEAFEYRIPLNISNFLISGLIAIVIALLTITYRSVKVINSNPVDSLRNE